MFIQYNTPPSKSILIDKLFCTFITIIAIFITRQYCYYLNIIITMKEDKQLEKISISYLKIYVYTEVRK